MSWPYRVAPNVSVSVAVSSVQLEPLLVVSETRTVTSGLAPLASKTSHWLLFAFGIEPS
jgi:hypothetical protein